MFLSFLFHLRNVDDWIFMGVFHSVSAFCNTGLSIFPSQLLAFSGDIPVMLVIAMLIVSGGLGFLVLHDILRFAAGRTRRISYHSKIVLFMTLLILAAGTVLFLFLNVPVPLAG